MTPKHPFRILLIFTITALLWFQASASDQRLQGFWVRMETEVPSKRWTLSANGTGIHESDFGPPYPGFVLTTYFTWTTNAENNKFIYTVNRQSATGNGPYNYDNPVSPPKTYSAPYTLTGTTNKIWAYEDYTYAQAASLTGGNTVGPGTLDTTFNKTGIVPFIQHAGTDGYGGVVLGAIQPSDGKVLVVSDHTDAAGQYRSYLTRYEIGGTVDKTFNGTGTRVIEFGRKYEQAKSIVVNPRNNKIVVAGTSYDVGSSYYPVIDGTLSRLTTSGSFDTTFNSTGKVLTDVGETGLKISGLAIQPSDGKIVVVGSIRNPNNPGQALILRYLTNGQLDTTFNATGRVSFPGGAQCIAIQPSDGKIVVGGSTLESTYNLWRFNTDGTLDTTFNPGGPEPGKFISGDHSYNAEVSQPFCNALAIRPSDGKIISGGAVYFYNGVQFYILCSNNSDGSPDLSFNGTGRVVDSFSTGMGKTVGGSYTYHTGSVTQLALQPDGKILVCGRALVGDYPDIIRKTAILRFNTKGTLDSTFNGTGKVFLLVDEIFGHTEPMGLLVQPADGKIVVFDPENMIRIHGRDYTPPTTKKYHSVTIAPVRARIGIVKGTGAYAAGTKVTLRAKAKEGYRFVGWKENGKELKKKTPYSIVLRANRALVAVFKKS